jgi:hypothetical protein
MPREMTGLLLCIRRETWIVCMDADIHSNLYKSHCIVREGENKVWFGHVT